MTTDEILSKIFSQTPLPNNLKQPKKNWLEGKMGHLAAINTIERYSNYTCIITLVEKT